MIVPTSYTNDLLSKYFLPQQSTGVAPNTLSTVAAPVAAPALATTTATQPDGMQQFLDLLNNALKATPPKQEPDPVEQARQQYRSEADKTFGPEYGQRVIASTLLDDTINSILSEQQNNAAKYLERGRTRGIYNDVGYNTGLARLGTAAQAGRSKLSSLGSSVIDKYRADANAVRDKAYAAASGYTPGSRFSLDPYISQANEVIGRAQTLAPGDLRNTFGGTQLFDFSSLNNAAGQAQGAINARDLDVMSAIANRKRANSFGRGLGSQGAF